MAISKSLRFDIFRRDKFTCQYCGNRPPDVILEVDHITPVSLGGIDDPANLVTSCYNCNRGKGTKTLKPGTEPHELDLDYLEAEQRLAELRRYREVRKGLEEALGGTISDLRVFTSYYFDTGSVPEDRAFRWLLYYHEPSEIEKAVILAAEQSKYTSASQKWRYACAILRNWRKNAIADNCNGKSVTKGV